MRFGQAPASSTRTPYASATVLNKGGSAKRKAKRKARRKRRFTSIRFDHNRSLRFPVGRIPSGFEAYGDDYNREIVDMPWHLS